MVWPGHDLCDLCDPLKAQDWVLLSLDRSDAGERGIL